MSDWFDKSPVSFSEQIVLQRKRYEARHRISGALRDSAKFNVIEEANGSMLANMTSEILSYQEISETVNIPFEARVSVKYSTDTPSRLPLYGLGALSGISLVAGVWSGEIVSCVISVALALIGVLGYVIWPGGDPRVSDPQKVQGTARGKFSREALFPENKIRYPDDLGPVVIQEKFSPEPVRGYQRG